MKLFDFVETTIDGKRRPAADVEADRMKIKTRMLADGKQYIEVLGNHGLKNAQGEAIETQCYLFVEV